MRDGYAGTVHATAPFKLRSRRRLRRKFVQTMVVPSSMSLFDLLQLLALFVCEIDGHLPVRLGNGLMNATGGLSPNVSELHRCFVDDRRNLGDLFRREVELGAEPFLHSRADQFRMMEPKEMMLRIHSPKKCAAHYTSDKHEEESGNEFPLQRAVHFRNSS